MTRAAERTRVVTVTAYDCRICHIQVVRHYFQGHDFTHDIIGQNRLCMRCYLDGKHEPGSLTQPGLPDGSGTEV